jgi:hypothetical protein
LPGLAGYAIDMAIIPAFLKVVYMKKAIIFTLLAYTSFSLAMDDDTAINLLPNPRAGIIIGIDRSLIARIHQKNTENEQLVDHDFSALESALAKSLDYDQSVQLLTAIDPRGLAYINLTGESVEIKKLAANRHVQFYLAYESPDEKGQYIAQQLKKDRKRATRIACWKGCAVGTALSAVSGLMAVLVTGMYCNNQ